MKKLIPCVEKLNSHYETLNPNTLNTRLIQSLAWRNYWPGLEDHSSGPGIVSRSLSRGESASLSSKHGFFLAREKSSSTLGVSRTASVSEGSCVKSATTRPSDSRECFSQTRLTYGSLVFNVLGFKNSSVYDNLKHRG